METFKLFNLTGNRWIDLSARLEIPFENVEQFCTLINSNFNVPSEFKTLDRLREIFPNEKVVNCLNFIRETALELPNLFPDGTINRLNCNQTNVQFTRRQVLCLLSHMFLCTLKESAQNVYWVTFQNWLTDGRDCAFAYFQCLFGYFEGSMKVKVDVEHDFWGEKLVFQRDQIDVQAVLNLLDDLSIVLSVPIIHSDGKIGDVSLIEVDFANKDIGFGIYGTQEEIMFGSSPEMCIAMLFCDTMLDNEVIVIRGAQKIGKFEGYGSNLKFNSLFFSFPDKDEKRNERIMIAMDALDLSSYDNPYAEQFVLQNLEREICKLLCGYTTGAILPGSNIDTGNWGCGAFCGDKYLKAVLQIIAASVASVQLHFFTFGDVELTAELNEFLRHCLDKNVTVNYLWMFIKKFKVSDEAPVEFMRSISARLSE